MHYEQFDNTSNNYTLRYIFDTDSISSTTIKESVSNTYNATLVNGATIAVDSESKVAGQGYLKLNSISSQYVTCPSFTTDKNGLTFSFWFRSNGSGTWGRVFDFGNDAGSDNIITFINNNNIGFSVYNNTQKGDMVNIINSINDNVWRHVVWTLTNSGTPGNSDHVWKIYLNGTLTSTQTNVRYPSNISRTKNYFGKSNWSGDSYFNGGIVDFRMYNRVISDQEISDIYNSPATAPLSTFQSQWNTIGCKRNLTENDVAWWRAQDNNTVKNDMSTYYSLASTCSGTQGQNDFCLPNSCKPPPTSESEESVESVESASVDATPSSTDTTPSSTDTTPSSTDTTPINFKSFSKKIMGKSKNGKTIKMYNNLPKCVKECTSNKKCIGIITKQNGFNKTGSICKTITDFSKPHNSSNAITYLKK